MLEQGMLGKKATFIVLAVGLGVGGLAWAATRGGGTSGGGLFVKEGDDGDGGGLFDRDDPVDRTLRTMSRAADRVCACKDTACAEVAMKALSNMKAPTGKPTRAQMERAMKLAERMAECQKTLITGDLPATLPGDDDPDDPDDE